MGMPVIPSFWEAEARDNKLEVSLDYTVIPYFQKSQKKSTYCFHKNEPEQGMGTQLKLQTVLEKLGRLELSLYYIIRPA